MGFFRNEKGTIISEYFKLIEPHANFLVGMMHDVQLYQDHILIKCGKLAAELQYNQITDVFYGMETEITEKEHSPIARAFIGGALFGGAGAIVGAMTATQKTKKRTFYFIISYTASDNGEEKIITFEDTRLYKGAKLAKKLKELANITPPSNHTKL